MRRVTIGISIPKGENRNFRVKLINERGAAGMGTAMMVGFVDIHVIHFHAETLGRILMDFFEGLE